MKTNEEILVAIQNIKKDIEFLSKKIGLHDMNLNRLNKKIEGMEDNKSSEQILEAIEELNNEEKQKLLNELFYKYYNNRNLPRMDIDWE